MICILILAISSVYFYMYTKLAANNTQVIAINIETDRESGEEDHARDLRKSVQSTSKERDLLDSLFLKKDETASLIEKIEGLASLSRVTHDLTVSTRDDTSLEGLNKEVLVTGVKVSGTWAQVYRFVSLFENLPYKITLADVRLDRAESTDPRVKGLIWNANITANFIKEK